MTIGNGQKKLLSRIERIYRPNTEDSEQIHSRGDKSNVIGAMLTNPGPDIWGRHFCLPAVLFLAAHECIYGCIGGCGR